jgi:hypothetical protein
MKTPIIDKEENSSTTPVNNEHKTIVQIVPECFANIFAVHRILVERLRRNNLPHGRDLNKDKIHLEYSQASLLHTSMMGIYTSLAVSKDGIIVTKQEKDADCIVTTLVHSMIHLKEYEEVQIECFKLLEILTYGSHSGVVQLLQQLKPRYSYDSKSGFEAIVCGMQQHPMDKTIQHKGCTIINYLVHYKELLETLKEQGAIRALGLAMEKHTKDLNIQVLAKKTLQFFLVD